MTGTQIINKFYLYVDDNSSLSSDESLEMLNKIYRRVLDYKPWEFLKKAASATIVNGEITLPADFGYIISNDLDSDEPDTVIFVGSNYEPYKIIPFSERRAYRNVSGYAYIDARQSKIIFTVTPSQTSAEYDYIYIPDDLTLNTSPVFPSRYHDILYHGMANDFAPIDNTPKERSYYEEHQLNYDNILQEMSLWNSKLHG